MLQSILFNKNVWNESQSLKWLLENNLIPIKLAHITPNYIRFRLVKPDKNKKYFSKYLDAHHSILAVFQ